MRKLVGNFFQKREANWAMNTLKLVIFAYPLKSLKQWVLCGNIRVGIIQTSHVKFVVRNMQTQKNSELIWEIIKRKLVKFVEK